MSDENQSQAERTEDFQRQADEAQPGLLWEFVDFLRHNKKWWRRSHPGYDRAVRAPGVPLEHNGVAVDLRDLLKHRIPPVATMATFAPPFCTG